MSKNKTSFAQTLENLRHGTVPIQQGIKAMIEAQEPAND